MSARRRVLFVGRTRYHLPLGESLARKWDELDDRLDIRVLASGTGDDRRFDLIPPRALDGPRFYLSLVGRVRRALRAFDPDVVIAESPYEAIAIEAARRLSRSRAKLVVELHGDWRISTRLYGSHWRKVAAPFADALASWALRSSDGYRAISTYTASLARGLGREPLGVFPAYVDLRAYTGPAVPVPDEKTVLYVGVLERLKNVDGLAAAWQEVRQNVADAHLHLVSSGSQTEVAEALQRQGARWDKRLEPTEVARALDRARLLVLPSLSEGLGRVIIESFLRGRPVVASRVGGIPDLVADGINGFLVDPDDVHGLAVAIERLLVDHDLCVRLGAAARETAERWLTTPEEFAVNVEAVVDRVLAQ